MKINELQKHHLHCNSFQVYDCEGVTVTEVLCEFFTKINECVKVSNETNDLANWLVNDGLSLEVAKQLIVWLNDGTLENVINVNLFKSLNEKIDNKDKQNKYLSQYKGEGSQKLQNALIDSVGCFLNIDEDVILNEIVNLEPHNHIKGVSGKKIKIVSGRITLNSNCVIEGCDIENMTINNNFGGNRGLQVFGDNVVFENIIIKNNTIKNFYYNIDIRTSTTSDKLLKHNNIKIEGNNLFNDYNSENAYGKTCGNLIVLDSTNVHIYNNNVIGGINSSAIGVTGGCQNVTITNNIVKNNTESSIQVENYPTYGHTQKDSDNANVIISNNVCDGSIWLDDCSNVNCNNNKCDSVHVTVQQFNVNNVVVTSNITGVINCDYFSTTPGDYTINNLLVSNNILIGSVGKHNQSENNKTRLINVSKAVISGKIINNKLDMTKTSNYGVELVVGLVGFNHVIYGNNDTKFRLHYDNVSTSQGVVMLTSDQTLNTPNYTTIERDKLWSPPVGCIVYDKTLKKCVLYKDNTSKWVNLDGTPL